MMRDAIKGGMMVAIQMEFGDFFIGHPLSLPRIAIVGVARVLFRFRFLRFVVYILPAKRDGALQQQALTADNGADRRLQAGRNSKQ